jgi:hypothetical protein
VHRARRRPTAPLPRSILFARGRGAPRNASTLADLAGCGARRPASLAPGCEGIRPTRLPRIDAEIEQLLATLDPQQLDAAAQQLGRRIPAARLRLRQAELALQAGDSAGAEAAINQASRLPLTNEDASRLATLEAALREGAGPGSDLLGSLPGIRVERGAGRTISGGRSVCSSL